MKKNIFAQYGESEATLTVNGLQPFLVWHIPFDLHSHSSYPYMFIIQSGNSGVPYRTINCHVLT